MGRVGLNRWAIVLEIIGGIGIAIGLGMLVAWAGIVALGLLLILFGMALERFEP